MGCAHHTKSTNGDRHVTRSILNNENEDIPVYICTCTLYMNIISLLQCHDLSPPPPWFQTGARDSQMALWSVCTLEDCGDSEREGNRLLAEDVRKMEPIIKFSNLMSDTNVAAHCERVRSLAYSKDSYVSVGIASFPGSPSLSHTHTV